MKKIFLFLSTLVMSFTACSHTFLTQTVIDEGGYLGAIYYGPFTLNEFQLVTLYNNKKGIPFRAPQLVRLICKNGRSIEEGRDTPPQDRSCGEIDFSNRSVHHNNDFNIALIASNYSCELLAATLHIDASNLAPVYLGPSSFVDTGTAAYGHHGEYKADGIAGYSLLDNLTFSCIAFSPAAIAESEELKLPN